MAAHRYWRVLLSCDNGNSRAAVSELQMRSTVGGASLCTGGTILSSGNSSGAVESRAFDGNTTTEWQSNITAGLAWLGYDFGSAVDIVEVSLRSGANTSMQSSFGYLQWSDDAAAWTLLAPKLVMGTASTTYLFSGFSDVAVPRRVGSALRLPTPWPAGPAGARLRGAPMRYDSVDGGTYSINSDVAISGTPDVPVARPVYLFTADNLRLIRSTWSDPVTGAYTFGKLRLQPYVVMARDYTAFYNAVVADRIMPVP